MTNPIVTVNVSQNVAPTPSLLQKSGAFLSQGATNTSPGTFSLLVEPADLTALLNGALALTSITWSGQVATAHTAVPHGLPIGDVIPVTIAGESPSGYNGTFDATITGASAFTYPLLVNPGSQTVAGTYTVEDVAELLAMCTTFFAQGRQQAVWVLELGPGGVDDGVDFLAAWITANPGVFYSYLAPRFWDGDSDFLAFLANYNSTDSQTYFFVTTTLATWQLYNAQMKCVEAMIEAPRYGTWSANDLISFSQTAGVAQAVTTTSHGVLPGDFFSLAGNAPAAWNGVFEAIQGTTAATLRFDIDSAAGAETALGELVASLYSSAGVPATEFSHAADFHATLNYKPSSTNKVTPLNLTYLFGVTPFPQRGNSAALTAIAAGNINYVDTGAQGGISALILAGGKVLDSRPFNYWYSVDWVQINAQRNVTAALISGSNNPINPIYFNQDGINALQQVIVATMGTGLASGLVLNPIKATTLSAADFLVAIDADEFAGYTVVNADPFRSYVAENPNDYASGIYDGFSISYVPLRGFERITINVGVSDFAA